MDEVNPIVLVSLLCCVGPALWGGLFFALGRWSGKWRVALQRRSVAEVQAHSDAVGYSGGDSGSVEPPPMPRERQRLIRQLSRGTASTTKRVDG